MKIYLPFVCSWTDASHPCASNASVPCCHKFTDAMGHNLESIMKVIRVSNGLGKTVNLKTYVKKEFKDISKYALNETKGYYTDEYDYLHTMIPVAIWNSLKIIHQCKSKWPTTLDAWISKFWVILSHLRRLQMFNSILRNLR